MTTLPTDAGEDRYDARRVGRATGLLRVFNEVGLLGPADVHVASRLAELLGETREDVQLATAFAVRAPRLGHVLVDLATIRETANVESEEPVDLSALPWPAAGEWIDAVAASVLSAVGEDDPRADRPLRLLGSRLYLDRYWREEHAVAAGLLTLADDASEGVDAEVLSQSLRRLFPEDADERQRRAAAAAVRCRLSVVAGGPGTGKTTTVARIVALLAEEAAAKGQRAPVVALAAPTGKAAARLQEAVHEEAERLDVSDEVRALLLGLRASTLHRLLGWRRGGQGRFLYGSENRLPHDVVVVDETSMVSLSLMARLVEAARADARLVLVGDPGQLRSIEAGVVLGDIVGPAAETTGVPAAKSRIGDGIVVLDRVHRYGTGIATVAEAIRGGDAEAAIDGLRSARGEINWISGDGDDDLDAVRSPAVDAGRAVAEAAQAGAARDALEALGRFRLLCAHRRGPYGVSNWTSYLEAWLSDAIEDLDVDERDYVGRPLLVTENDYELGLYNGDTGVIVAGSDSRPVAVFERGGELLTFSPYRLAAVETVYAMTIHKSQGSQFDTAAVLLPPVDSPILTRELLYTAVTRARHELILVATEEIIRHAVATPVARASGLRERLWDEDRSG